ncbi:MAG TPA: aminodeoxychorismate synthase component I, partial [Rhodanobacteraceae bacterium]
RALWPDRRVYATPLVCEWDRAAYRRRFQSVLQAIRAGETYEVNLSMRARFHLTGDPRALYGRLRQQALGTYGAFIDDGERQLLSLSPEMFFTVQPGGAISVRPMKGTAPRAADAATDRALAAGLRASAKDRAENLMIVDLLRNDLGRIAVTGSVTVPQLFCIETYPTVHQMTSTVQATLRPRVGIAELLRALYPCGSVTGAPKIRTMQIIRRLEASPRGAYCGALGVFAPDGSARFNVAIRTLTVANGHGELGIGSAVTSGSEADGEYEECLLKARFYDVARRPLTLLETMPFLHGTWPRRERHLRRMQRSAQALGIPFDPERAVAMLQAAQRAYGTDDRRVRLCLREDGQLCIDAQPLPQPRAPLHFIVSAHRIRSDAPLNQHKTDWREANQQALADAHAQGADEAILVNQRGEISEGTYTNVFIEHDGRLLTPPLASGALPGCLREELLESGRCAEAVLTVRDLLCAEHVFLGNSLRGLIAATPVCRITITH